MNRYTMIAMIFAIVFLVMNPPKGYPSDNVTLEPAQARCIQMVYDIGNTIEIYGDIWGETIAGIAYQESWCNSSRWKTHGVVIGDLNSKGVPRSLGIMQVQVPTARWIGKKYPHIFKDMYGERTPTDEEIAIDLLIDNRFNIIIGSHYFKAMLSYRKGDWNKAILSYNRGVGSNLKDVNNYVYLVKKWRKTRIIPFIKGNYIIKEEV